MNTNGPPMTNLGIRIVRGGAWLAGAQLNVRLLTLVRTIVVARILVPSDLGILAMALIAISVLRMLTETGFEQALIQRTRVADRTLHVAWTALIVRNAAITVVLFLTADLVGRFFEAPTLAASLRVLCVSVLLDGLTSIALVLFQKRLDFKKQFIYEISGQICEFVVAVVLVVVLRSVWALVIGRIAGSSVRLVVSYMIHPHRPRLLFDWKELRQLLGYGKWLTMSGVLVFLLLEGDDIFVGKLFGVAMLGYYRIAYSISNFPATGISRLLAMVMFPAYSSIQHDLPRVRHLYLRSLRLTALLTIPLSALIAVLADLFTQTVLGEKWLPIVPVLQIFALFGVLRSLGGTTGAVFLALGRPDIRTKIQLGQLIVFAATIYPFARVMGLVGVALAATLQALIFTVYAVWRTARLVDLEFHRVVPTLAGPMACTAGLFAIVHALRSTVLDAMAIPALLLLGTIGSLGYVALISMWDRWKGGVYRGEITSLYRNLAGMPRN